MNHKITLETALEAANILRVMCDSEEETNKLLRERIHQLEMVLIEHNIAIPDYEMWHGEFPTV
ncbi:hypothetical protein [Anaerobium acetethylicum]|uniref:Uncharacterized protein n=1 Tax=Anaerobium acetethylicum TaxID=1619234 RepID=A0A1D3TYL8_9FIRM|nr:hypothetical protein [Anaerobium acetethylicum]SCP99570.1 hypothetical protein SAMN05421730_104618 [Anaerobium acetethylicum]